MKECLRAGSVIGNYQVIMRIGVSSFGEIYRVQDPATGKDGALKLLPHALGFDDNSCARFVQIINSSPTIEHRNVSRVISAGITNDGRPYAVSEFVRGQSLDEIGIGLARTLAEKIHLIIEIALGVDAAHKSGVFHLALRPSNIMLTSNGNIKILDFVVALATQVALLSRPASAPRVKTTLDIARYLSPEQVRGEKPSKQSDIFALGVIAYELFSSNSPFNGRSPEEVTVAIVRDTPLPLVNYLPDAPPELDEILRKAFAKTPESRYGSAGEFAKALQDLVAKQANLRYDSSKPTGKSAAVQDRLGPAAALFKKNLRPILIYLLFGALFLGLAIAAVYIFSNSKTPEAAPVIVEVSPELRVASSPNVTEAVISPDGQALAYLDRNGDKMVAFYKVIDESRELVLGVSNQRELQHITITRDGEWVYFVETAPPANELYVNSVKGGKRRLVLSGIHSGISFSPNGNEFAFIRSTSTTTHLIIHNVKNNTDRVLTQLAAPAFFTGEAIAWSKDGQTIATTVKRPDNDLMPAIAGFSVQNGAESQILPGRWPEIGAIEWVKEDKSLLVNARALTGTQWQLWQIAVSGGQVNALTKGISDFRHLSISKDSLNGISLNQRRAAGLWLGTNDTATQLTGNIDDGLHGLTWINNEEIVFTSRKSGKVDLWTTNVTKSIPTPLQWESSDNTQARLHPIAATPANEATGVDGSTIFFTNVINGEAKIARAQLSSKVGTNSLVTKFSDLADQLFPLFTSADKQVHFSLFHNGQAVVGHLPLEGQAEMQSYGGNLWLATPSPDGTKLVANQYNETTGLWHIVVMPRTGGGAIEIPGLTAAHPRRVRFTPDGNALAYVETRKGIANIWQKPLDPQSTPSQITQFTRYEIHDFAWSPNGQQLVVARSKINGDVYRISGW